MLLFSRGLRTIVDYLHCGTKIIYEECTSLVNTEFLEKEAEVVESINV